MTNAVKIISEISVNHKRNCQYTVCKKYTEKVKSLCMRQVPELKQFVCDRNL